MQKQLYNQSNIIPNILIKINQIYTDKLTSIKTLSKNKVTTCKTWSTFHEVVQYLTKVDIDDKKKIFLEQSQDMATTMFGESIYSLKFPWVSWNSKSTVESQSLLKLSTEN